MFQENYIKSFKDVSRIFKRSSKVVSRQFVSFLRKYQGCLKKVSGVFQENYIKSFFLLQFRCMNLIAATRAEGGLVSSRAALYLTLNVCLSVFSQLYELDTAKAYQQAYN